MSKYDFEIDMSDKSSTGVILGEINRGSVVLEFGCAFGRMTRYMKEELSCKVYIVEYDAEAFDTAIKYAEDGLCEDICEFRWFERFKNIAFDAIIFADVLEHLQCPESVIEKAAELLNDTGKIHISIPNITHNDVLLKAYNECFDYTSTGILDDTHVHFWGLKNIDKIVGNSGLSVRKVTATYCETGYTEQFDKQKKEDNILLENLLRERQCGEVYQFIITLDKEQGADAVYALKMPALKCMVYLDKGNDFSADDCTEVYASRSVDGGYHVHCEINDTANIKRVRLDPVEHQNCILKNISFRQGENELEFVRSSDANLENGYIFLGDDPMIYADVEENGAEIIIDADIFIWSESYLQVFQADYLKLHNDNLKLQTEHHNLQIAHHNVQVEHRNVQTEYQHRCNEIAAASKHIADLTKSEKESRDIITALQSEISQLNKDKADLNEIIEQYKADCGALNFLVYKKDAYAMRLKQQIAELEKRYKRSAAYFIKRVFAKLRSFIVRAAKKVLKCLKAIVGKGEKR